MFATLKSLLMSTSLLFASLAYADGTTPQNGVTEKGNNGHAPPPHSSNNNLRFTALKYLSLPAEPSPGFRFQATEQPSPKTAIEPRTPVSGMRFNINNQRPELEYRFNDSGTLHVHVMRHGGALNADWQF